MNFMVKASQLMSKVRKASPLLVAKYILIDCLQLLLVSCEGFAGYLFVYHDVRTVPPLHLLEQRPLHLY